MRFEDWHAINNLLMVYAEHIDAARFTEAAALFEQATYRLERADGSLSAAYEGREQIEAFFAGTRVHADGTPRTKHVVTNVVIEPEGDGATARCYATVFQQTDELPLQPIAAGRYLDRFEQIDGRWRFADRLVTGFLLGDRSQHVVWHAGTAPAQPGA
jgi:3-phenylpropionate/cinnamic acid dioxygenase small subunit